MRIGFAVLLFLVLLLCSGAAFARDWFMATNGVYKLKSSLAGTPNCIVQMYNTADGITDGTNWTMLGTAPTVLTWDTDSVTTYLRSNGNMRTRFCACPQNGSDYQVSFDYVKVTLTLQ